MNRPSRVPLSGSLDRLLRPRSVAIIGASESPGALGASVLSNLERLGYRGDIHLVNPKRDSIGGRPCVRSIDGLPEGVDAAVVAIPKAAVLEAIRGLARRKCGAAVVFSSGFAESGEAGLAEQREIARVAGEAGMVVVGPNCLGFTNYVDKVALTFVETPAPGSGAGKGIGIVSQSGAMAAVLGVNLVARGLNLTYSVSTGNEAASGVGDFVEDMLEDPATSVIAMVVEQFRDPGRFLGLAQRARQADKALVLLHPGRSQAARESAATHTGAMAGDYAVMRVKCEGAGVILVDSLEELGDVAEIASRCARLPRGGAAILAESGAFKALTLDLCEEIGLALPVMTDGNSPALRAAMPDFVPVSNPVDLTAQVLVDPDMYRRTLNAIAGDDRFGGLVLPIIQTDPLTAGKKYPPILAALRDLETDKPILLAGVDEGAVIPREYIEGARALGIPYFPSPERALRAFARIAARREDHGTAERIPPLAAQGLPAQGVVPEYRAKRILGPLGVPFPRSILAATLDAALEAGSALGYPLVLKAQSMDLSHKSDAGGVIVGLADAEALARGWERLQANLARNRPGLRLEGVLVEAMGERGIELIVGGRNDPEWGPVVLAGFGGVQAEIYQDVRLLAPGLDRKAIVSELNRLKGAALLNGFRGSPPVDLDAVAGIVQIVGRLLAGEPKIREIDLNPVVAYPRGEGAMALDALILMASSEK
jgi:acetate---CoA ligase (ADP-forming)